MIFQEPMTSLNPGAADRRADRRGGAASIAACRGGGSAAHGRSRCCERVRIPAAEKRLDEFPHQLSGGMRQRAMIAMALANDPALLIADEPTTALDVTIQAQILDLMRSLRAETGAAMILITHDLGVVAEMADKVAVMYAGPHRRERGRADIFDDPQHPYTLGPDELDAVAHGRREERLVTIPGTVPPRADMPAGCRFAARCPFARRDCREAPPLAEIGPGHASPAGTRRSKAPRCPAEARTHDGRRILETARRSNARFVTQRPLFGAATVVRAVDGVDLYIRAGRDLRHRRRKRLRQVHARAAAGRA